MPKVRASYEFSGLPDYWGGNGRRWDSNAGCVFAYYDGSTTLRDLIDSAVSDFCMGGDFEPDGSGRDPWRDVSEDEVREALLDCLSDAGRADYDSGAIWEGAAEYAAVNGFNECRECGAPIGEPHYDDCPIREDAAEDGGDTVIVTDEDCEPDYDYCDSPVCIFLLEVDECEECGAGCDHAIDELCADCAVKHGYDV